LFLSKQCFSGLGLLGDETGTKKEDRDSKKENMVTSDFHFEAIEANLLERIQETKKDAITC